MDSEEEFARKRHPNRLYFTGEFPDLISGRKKRFLRRVLPSGECEHFAELDGEFVIRVAPGGLQQIRALFYTDTGDIEKLTLQTFSDEKPTKRNVFNLRGDEIKKLLQVAALTRLSVFEDGGKVRIDEADLEEFALTSAAARTLAKSNPKLIAQLAESEITERDVVALAYRKKQIEVFRRLLEEPDFFAAEKFAIDASRDEDVWQDFFERNCWIFGYGLFYVFTTKFQAKLEQVVAGASIAGGGKRTDGLLKTLGLVSSLCFVELKKPETNLLAGTEYRSDAWAVSSELSGAIAQSQRTIAAAEKTIREHLDGQDDAGYPTGDRAYFVNPRAVVVAGTLKQFCNEHGVNKPKFTSFEMFRRSINTPEIVTYDELFERARFIVEAQTETEA
jgi:hypothetical protein